MVDEDLSLHDLRTHHYHTFFFYFEHTKKTEEFSRTIRATGYFVGRKRVGTEREERIGTQLTRRNTQVWTHTNMQETQAGHYTIFCISHHVKGRGRIINSRVGSVKHMPELLL